MVLMALKPYQNKDYYDWICTLPSWVSKSNRSVECHHSGLGEIYSGFSKRKCDYASIPLTSEEHRKLHDTSQRVFFDGKINNILIVYYKLLKMYFEHKKYFIPEEFQKFPKDDNSKLQTQFILSMIDCLHTLEEM